MTMIVFTIEAIPRTENESFWRLDQFSGIAMYSAISSIERQPLISSKVEES